MRRRFERQGFLAIHPQAFLELYVEGPPERAVHLLEGAAVVDVQGPLVHHAGSWEDSYEGLVERVTAACGMDARTVVLRIDSPGGDMHGAMDAARTIRERVRASGKRLLSYISGNGCSAAYALAAAADSIQVSDTACVGSIGVLFTRLDATRLDAAMGTAYTLITSGAHKADQNVHTSTSPEELLRMRAQCEALAGVFFELVATFRPGLSADGVRALEAGTFIGQEAVRLGLADGVASDLRAAIAAAEGGTSMDDEETQARSAASSGEDDGAEPSSSQADVDEARAALQRAANDGNESARRALAELDAEGPGDEDEDEDEDEGEESASASASATTASASTTVSADAAGGLAAQFQAVSCQVQELMREREQSRISALLAGRKDLAPALRKHLRTMRSAAEVEAIVSRIPKPTHATSPAAPLDHQLRPTRGQSQGSHRHAVTSSPDTERMDRAFGITADAGGIDRSIPHAIVFRTPHGRPRTVAAPAAQPSTGTGEGSGR